MLLLLIILLLLLLGIIILGRVIVANGSGLKCQTGCLVLRSYSLVLGGNLLVLGQVTLSSMGDSSRLTGLVSKGVCRRRMAVPLGDLIVQIDVVLSGL